MSNYIDDLSKADIVHMLGHSGTSSQQAGQGKSFDIAYLASQLEELAIDSQYKNKLALILRELDKIIVRPINASDSEQEVVFAPTCSMLYKNFFKLFAVQINAGGIMCLLKQDGDFTLISNFPIFRNRNITLNDNFRKSLSMTKAMVKKIPIIGSFLRYIYKSIRPARFSPGSVSDISQLQNLCRELTEKASL